MIDIIILSYNLSGLTIKCLDSIKQHTDPRTYRIILIDNNSEVDEFKAVEDRLDEHPHLLVRNNKNLGFVKAVNQGMCLVTAPYFVLMNNDTEAVEQWAEKLMAALTGSTVVSGSRTTTKGSWQGNWEGRVGLHQLPPGAMLAFFCTMFKSEVIEKVGLLDEAFGMGFGDDDDYCMRIQKRGYNLALVQDLVIPHHHRATWKSRLSSEEIKSQQEANLKTYKEKYGLT